MVCSHYHFKIGIWIISTEPGFLFHIVDFNLLPVTECYHNTLCSENENKSKKKSRQLLTSKNVETTNSHNCTFADFIFSLLYSNIRIRLSYSILMDMPKPNGNKTIILIVSLWPGTWLNIMQLSQLLIIIEFLITWCT